MRTLLAAAAALCIVSGLCVRGECASVSVPEITPRWTEQAPVVDGRLDDGAWAQAEWISDFRTAGGQGKAVTSAAIVYDGKAFYAAFRCKAPEASLEVVNKEEGSPVWQDESVELFLSPFDAPDLGGLMHFVVNAGGAKAFLVAEEVRRNSSWEARAARTEDGWSAEIRLPLEVFDPQGQNEAAWRLLFGRNSKEFDESSSWPYSNRWAFFWNHARLLSPAGKPSFLKFRGEMLPREAGQEPKGIAPLKQISADTPEHPLILPQPVQARFTGGRFPLSGATTVLIGQSANAKDARAAEVIAEWIERKAGFRPRIERVLTAEQRSLKGRIVVGETSLNPASGKLARQARIEQDIREMGAEGYVVRVTRDEALVSGFDSDGTFWGAQTLAQMIQGDGVGGWWIAGGTVKDRPAMPFRSVHLLTTRDALQFQSKLIRDILSPFKINYVILQMDKYDWQSHPEITDPNNHISPQDMKKLISTGRDYNITYIPLVMSLGHMEWIFRGGNHLDIAEDPQHPYAYCPLNENSYKLMFDLFDEAYALFGKPGYFHIGHDEFDMIGEFPTHEECRKLGKTELYYRDTQKVTARVKEMGARPMMWGDILLKPGFNARLNELPKDVVIADWHYSPVEEYPSVDLFRKHEFEVVACPWYDHRNIFHLSDYAFKHGASGMMQTTWSGWEPSDVVFKNWPEQMFQYVLGAEWAWSPGVPPLSAMPYEADEVFNSRWWDGANPAPGAGAVLPAGGELVSIGIAPWANASARDSDGAPGWIGVGEGEDFSSLRAGNRRLGSLTYRILSSAGGKASVVMLRGTRVTAQLPESVKGIAVGSKAKQLWFLHTTAYPDGPDRRVGSYTVRYSDGSSETIPLVYGQNIMAWTDNRPTLDYQSAWRGQAKSGRPIRLRALPWNNPHPDREIASIDFDGYPGNSAAPVLFAITAIR